MEYVTDRVVNGIAVLMDADLNRIEIRADVITGNVREGCAVSENNGIFSVDEERTVELTVRNKAKLDKIFKKRS